MSYFVNGRPCAVPMLADTRGFLYGEQVFTSFVVKDGKIWGLEEHLKRLASSLQWLYPLDDFSQDSHFWAQDLKQVIPLNGELRVRLMPLIRSLKLKEKKMVDYQRLISLATFHRSPKSFFNITSLPVSSFSLHPSHFKGAIYAEKMRQWRLSDRGDEIIYYNEKEELLDGLVSSFVFYKDQKWIHLPLQAGRLSSITLEFWKKFCHQKKMPTQEKNLFVKDLDPKTGILLLNSVQGAIASSSQVEERAQEFNHYLEEMMKPLNEYLGL